MFKAQSFLRSKKEAITSVWVFVEGGKQIQKTSPTKWYWVGSPWRIKEVWINITIHLSSGASGKEPACQHRRPNRLGSNPWMGKIPWRRVWQPLQYSCLENPMDRGDWGATVHSPQSWTRLNRLSMQACIYGERLIQRQRDTERANLSNQWSV